MDTNEFLERTTVREILGLSPAVVGHARRVAHQLYRAGRFAEADVVCRGLIACDHRFGWTYSLHAAVLRKLGRRDEALVQAERGLLQEPGHAKLLRMRDELRGRGAGTDAQSLARPPGTGGAAIGRSAVSPDASVHRGARATASARHR